MDHQDWKTVTISKKNNKNTQKQLTEQHKKYITLDNHTGENAVKKTKGNWGKRIIQIRMKKKMNQKQFSNLINVKQALLSDWEKNISNPPNHVKNKILSINI